MLLASNAFDLTTACFVCVLAPQQMRQWVLVACWNPVVVFMSEDCYARFAVEAYDTAANERVTTTASDDDDEDEDEDAGSDDDDDLDPAEAKRWAKKAAKFNQVRQNCSLWYFLGMPIRIMMSNQWELHSKTVACDTMLLWLDRWVRASGEQLCQQIFQGLQQNVQL
eukprot:SAG31_NODE_1550_length_7909_cov_4.107554_6_plen_167_part_00